MSQENKKSFFSEPPADGSLSDNPSISAFITSLNRNWKAVCEEGAFVFDIDETLIPPDDSLANHEQLTQLLARLLQSGVYVSLISGGPGAVIENRVLNPLLAKGLSPEAFGHFILYTNGGSTKVTYQDGQWVEDVEFTVLHQIPGTALNCFKKKLETLIQKKFHMDDHDHISLLRIWREKRHEQWKNCDIAFKDGWMRGEPWNLEYWEDHKMAQVKAGLAHGTISYPFINTRCVQYDAQGCIKQLLGFSAAGFYYLSQEKGDLVDFDIRDDLIQKIQADQDPLLSCIAMRKAGRSSIDVIRKGADKAAALKNFIETTSRHGSLVFYFGDEFFEGGNDQPIADSAELKKLGLCILALNKEIPPKQTHILWMGRSYDATGQFLASLPV